MYKEKEESYGGGGAWVMMYLKPHSHRHNPHPPRTHHHSQQDYPAPYSVPTSSCPSWSRSIPTALQPRSCSNLTSVMVHASLLD